jgi:hypothetical protein
MPHPRAARTAHAAPCRKGTINLSLPQAAGLEKGKRKNPLVFSQLRPARGKIAAKWRMGCSPQRVRCCQKGKKFVRFVKNVPGVLYFVISALYNRTNGSGARCADAANRETPRAS